VRTGWYSITAASHQPQMELYCPIWKAKNRYGRETADRIDFVWKSRMTGRMALQPVTRCRPGVASNSTSNTRSESTLSIASNRHRSEQSTLCVCIVCRTPIGRVAHRRDFFAQNRRSCEGLHRPSRCIRSTAARVKVFGDPVPVFFARSAPRNPPRALGTLVSG
jgi:hypothetical protein